MEINEENIDKVARILKAKDFERALGKVQDYSRIAQELMEKHPELTADQLGELYEQQMEQENEKQTQDNEGQEIDE